jgi:hypothetical protein
MEAWHHGQWQRQQQQQWIVMANCNGNRLRSMVGNSKDAELPLFRSLEFDFMSFRWNDPDGSYGAGWNRAGLSIDQPTGS